MNGYKVSSASVNKFKRDYKYVFSAQRISHNIKLRQNLLKNNNEKTTDNKSI